MGKFSQEIWYLDITQQFDAFIKVLDVKIESEEKQLQACVKKSKLQTKMAQEMKINKELIEYYNKLVNRKYDLDRICATLKTRLTIADSDQERLNNAKETIQIIKEITGVRPDFSAPPTVTKGYIKSHPRKLLQPFEFPGSDVEALWSLIRDTATPGWPVKYKKGRRDDPAVVLKEINK